MQKNLEIIIITFNFDSYFDMKCMQSFVNIIKNKYIWKYLSLICFNTKECWIWKSTRNLNLWNPLGEIMIFNYECSWLNSLQFFVSLIFKYEPFDWLFNLMVSSSGAFNWCKFNRPWNIRKESPLHKWNDSLQMAIL